MDELLYEDIDGDQFLLDYSPSHSGMIIRRINISDPNNVFSIDPVDDPAGRNTEYPSIANATTLAATQDTSL